MGKRLRLLSIAAILGISMLACYIPGISPAIETVPTPTPTEEAERLLPYSLYYLSDSGGGFVQVWRMEADGTAQSQLTFEPDDVSGFDVSQADGSIVYVVNNQLYWVDAHGAGRRLLIDGGPIDETGEYYYRRKIRSPLWSPDGTVIAFGQDGLVFYQFSTGTVSNPLKNDFRALEDGSAIPTRILSPERWSPDGMKLLFNNDFYEGSSAGIFDMARADAIEFNEEPGCCFMVWSADSKSVLIASPYIQYADAGLWRYDIDRREVITLVEGRLTEEVYRAVSYPLETAEGELFFFFAEIEEVPYGDNRMLAMRANPSAPLEMLPIWNEAVHVYEALWAPDGSLVLLVQPSGETIDYPYHGPVVRISFSTNESQTILVEAFNLRWGP